MIKTILSILLIINITSIMSQEIKQYEKWGMFYTDFKYNFSESFKAEMCKQLKLQFDLQMNINKCADKYGFMLSFGQIDPNIIEKDGYMFALVEISDLMTYTRTLTFCWKSDDFKKQTEIQKSNIKNKNVSFYWCLDFPKEDFLKILEPNIKFKKGYENLNFDVDLYLYLLPDISFYFEFKEKPTKQDINNINSFFNQYKSINPNLYINELTEYDSEFVMMIDFQSTDENIDVYVNSLKELFKGLSKIDESNKILEIMAR
jgi:hypothetical protein